MAIRIYRGRVAIFRDELTEAWSPQQYYDEVGRLVKPHLCDCETALLGGSGSELREPVFLGPPVWCRVF